MERNMSQPIGYVIESVSHRSAIAVSRHSLPVGEYVSARFRVEDPIRGERDVTALAVVSQVSHLPVVPESVYKLVGPEPRTYTQALSYTKSILYVIAQIDADSGRAEPPKYPMPPNTPIEPASRELLSRVYMSDRGLVRIGLLAPRELGVEIRVDPNKLTKHLFIAGATGSGKSNTVAVLVDRLSALGAPVVIFDVHGEYDLIPEDGNASKIEKVSARLNPLRIPPRMMASIIIPDTKATRQRRAVYRALAMLSKDVKKIKEKEGLSTEDAVLKLYASIKPKHQKGEDEDSELHASSDAIHAFQKLLILKLKNYVQNIDDKTKATAIDKIEDFFDYTPLSLSDDPVVTRIKRGRILVVDASDLTDEQKRWALKTIVDSILERLKSAKGDESLILVVEEAPLFLSGLTHPVKESLQRFAREGRKFGGCLVVVSQRPRSLDVNVVSQLQNFVFLRMVQQEDIKTIMSIADSLDESLASVIPSLPDGRAIVMGEWLGKFPALVDIDYHRGKRAGATPNIIELWKRREEEPPSFPLEPF